MLFVTYIEYLRFINLLCGDFETNSGLFNRCKSISFYHWNLNGLLDLNDEKFHLVEAFVVSNNTDVFCISSVCLLSSGLNINSYTLVQIDHPSNTKRDGVAIYYKDHLPVIKRMIFLSGMSIVLRLANNKCFFNSLYRSPSQIKDKFGEFCSGFNMLISKINDKKPLASIITGDFNARSKNWWSEDITNSQGSIIDTLTSTSGYHQLINLPSHMTNTSSSENLVLKSLFIEIITTIVLVLVRRISKFLSLLEIHAKFGTLMKLTEKMFREV